MNGEFDLIRTYFRSTAKPASGVLLGVGDDAALLAPTPGHTLVVATDTLVAGRHFPADTAARDIGHKLMAVNLSDMAAMGARPRWALLALTLPEADADWLAAFADGLFALARLHDVSLVGGDTTRGPLTLSLTLLGEVPAGGALRRDAARPGDWLGVTGTLGDAGLGLALALGDAALREQVGGQAAFLRERLDRPTPRVAQGRALAAHIGQVHACIDVSDGLAQDLGHVLSQSGVGAEIDVARLPLSPAVREHCVRTGDPSLPLCAGDDYELLFSFVSEAGDALREVLDFTVIGRVTAEPGLRLLDEQGKRIDRATPGHDHFR